ncbi:hypothetical protein [Latilactobacillus graminis]|uniref:Uncharacterized protein n=2 Tax=Latilactobacillus graminis TaxID=60519 RepID=A0AA89I203_9LACO|nr:hypothetical protein [Latilactobacillus graminis]KRM24265.1 hypothetical protein FC90_GL000742 [Latilactobacillus graminis DSM 20719]QFP78757.1 hypothetical protein LG542_00160 [Latilactobacillus graminis]
MKLYQALTQVTLNTNLVNDLPDFQITPILSQPLNFSPTQLYHYIDAVLKSGSRHDENNLLYVTDAIFITENYHFQQTEFAVSAESFEDRITLARKIVADLNRHVSVNLDLTHHVFQLIFVD